MVLCWPGGTAFQSCWRRVARLAVHTSARWALRNQLFSWWICKSLIKTWRDHSSSTATSAYVNVLSHSSMISHRADTEWHSLWVYTSTFYCSSVSDRKFQEILNLKLTNTSLKFILKCLWWVVVAGAVPSSAHHILVPRPLLCPGLGAFRFLPNWIHSKPCSRQQVPR